jgi:hypothetical protein
MKLKKQKKTADMAAVAIEAPQCRHPFYAVASYTPLQPAEYYLYQSLREAIPVLDAAIRKLCRLLGHFSVDCGDEQANKRLTEFLQKVRVGATGQGIDTFLSAYFDQLLTGGTAVGEIVFSRSGEKISALYNAPASLVEIKQAKNPMKCTVCVKQNGGSVPVMHPERILLTALNPEPGQVVGNSLFRSLPFVSSILLKIYNTIGVNFDRIGNLRFAVTYNPGDNSLDKAYAKERAEQIAAQWGSAMKSSEPKDFISVGDVSIRVIGADNQFIDTEIPVRQMLEQIVSITGLPPFMLGLTWSTTERMSSQQADILTSEMEAYRRTLSPILYRICNMWLLKEGYYRNAEIIWDDINLQDETELAKARLLRAQAAQIEEKLKGSM